MLFISGILKCFEKPLSLENATFNCLSMSVHPAKRTATRNSQGLETYVEEARAILLNTVFFAHDFKPPPIPDYIRRAHPELKYVGKVFHHNIPESLFVDYAYPYSERLEHLRSFWSSKSYEAYEAVQRDLACTFDVLYTKNSDPRHESKKQADGLGAIAYLIATLLPIVAILLSFTAAINKHTTEKTSLLHLRCCTVVLGWTSFPSS